MSEKLSIALIKWRRCYDYIKGFYDIQYLSVLKWSYFCIDYCTDTVPVIQKKFNKKLRIF